MIGRSGSDLGTGLHAVLLVLAYVGGCTTRRVWASLLLVALFSLSFTGAPADDGPITGFTPARAAEQRALEKLARALCSQTQ